MPRLPGITDRISRADRVRLLDRLDELDGLEHLMREGGSMASAGEPLPLHKLPAASAATLGAPHPPSAKAQEGTQ